ncbi:MAG: VOC family protein [Bacillota bacterium]
MKLEIGAIGIYVKDIEKMVEFYRDAMGCDIEWNGGSFAGVRMSTGIFFNLCVRDSTDRFSYTDGINGTFQVSCNVENADDVDRDYERLLKIGATSIYPPTTEPYGMRVSFVADPEGNQIEICASLDD